MGTVAEIFNLLPGNVLNLWTPEPGQTVTVTPEKGPVTVTGQGVHVLIPVGQEYTFNVEAYLQGKEVCVYRWRIQHIAVPNFWARTKTRFKSMFS